MLQFTHSRLLALALSFHLHTEIVLFVVPFVHVFYSTLYVCEYIHTRYSDFVLLLLLLHAGHLHTTKKHTLIPVFHNIHNISCLTFVKWTLYYFFSTILMCTLFSLSLAQFCCVFCSFASSFRFGRYVFGVRLCSIPLLEFIGSVFFAVVRSFR